jgi:hypothetical protein
MKYLLGFLSAFLVVVIIHLSGGDANTYITGWLSCMGYYGALLLYEKGETRKA